EWNPPRPGDEKQRAEDLEKARGEYKKAKAEADRLGEQMRAANEKLQQAQRRLIELEGRRMRDRLFEFRVSPQTGRPERGGLLPVLPGGDNAGRLNEREEKRDKTPRKPKAPRKEPPPRREGRQPAGPAENEKQAKPLPARVAASEGAQPAD